jgi:hypothetical protein
MLESCSNSVRIWNLSEMNKNMELGSQLPLIPPPNTFTSGQSAGAGTANWFSGGREDDGAFAGWSVDGLLLFSLTGDVVSGNGFVLS